MSASPFSEIPLAPPDPILGLTEAFNADPSPNKVNLGVGVYQNDSGQVPVLQVVREAEERWHQKENSKNYLPIDGSPSYDKEVQKLILGADSPLIAEGRVLTAQAPGGTGGLRVGADFLSEYRPGSTVYLSDPTWANHNGIFASARFETASYPYYDGESQSLKFDAMKAAIGELPEGSIVLLHACCHNPTGVDPTPEQWIELAQLFKGGRLIPFIDFAYQGFGDGNDADAVAARAFANEGISCLIASSFSKSFSLYRERVGALTILTADAEETKKVLSQIKRVIRVNYSNPPSHGAQIVAMILSDSELKAKWETELTEMRERIHRMRTLFALTLKEKGVKRDFSFIARQKGMFSFLGISVEAVKRLRAEYSLYIVNSSRVCVAAMNERNIGYICDALAKVLE